MEPVMAQVPTRVLEWLWNALQNTYPNAAKAYSDSVATLSTFPSLQPRTDVYTYNNGQPALLLCLAGTLPVNFRGTVYRFPVTIWVPQAYPYDHEGIMVYVNAGENMMIRPGQHVAVDGRVYHPYLRDWGAAGGQQQSSIGQFLRILQDVFAKEPPVIARQPQAQQQYHQYHQNQQRPPAPPKERPGVVEPVEMPAGGPPPRPPKPGDEARAASPAQAPSRNINQDGPPLPPLPPLPGVAGNGRYSSPQPRGANGLATPPRAQSGCVPPRQYSPSPSTGPPPPPLPIDYRDSSLSQSPRIGGTGLRQQQQQQQQQQQIPRPMPYPADQQQQQIPQQYMQMPPVTQYQAQPQTPYQQPQSIHPQYQSQRLPSQHQQQQQPPKQQQRQQQPQYQPQPVTPKPAPTPAPDLLTSPFDITLPDSTSTGPPPPIPPNPEKEHLLHLLSQTLHSQLTAKLHQNNLALTPLRAQSSALADAHSRLHAELAQLQQLDSQLDQNEAILNASMRDCETILTRSASLPDIAIDDFLVAPTVVQNQLWMLEAEIAGLREVLWCVQRALGAGRVGGDAFVRLNRGLGRELFLKMALARKVAKGLGLDVGAVSGHVAAVG